jgi:hypothetical protein
MPLDFAASKSRAARSRNRCSGRLKVDHVSTGVDAQFRQTPVVSEEKHLCVVRQFTNNLQRR